MAQSAGVSEPFAGDRLAAAVLMMGAARRT
jgi:hypothetical protein